MHDDEHPDGLARCSTVSSNSSQTRVFGKFSAVAVAAAEMVENESIEPVNAERQRSGVRSKGVKYPNSARFSTRTNLEDESNEFESEL